MEGQSTRSSTQATADSSLGQIENIRMYEEAWIDRMCLRILCCERTQEGRIGAYESLTQSPGQVDTPAGTLCDAKSLSQDSMPAPTGVGRGSQLCVIDKQPKRSDKVTRYSWPPKERQQTTGPTCESQPSTSTSADQFKQFHGISQSTEQLTHPKSDDPESVSPNTDTSTSSDVTTVQSVRQVVVNIWNYAKNLKFPVRRRSESSSLTSPPDESPPESTNPEVPSDIPKPDGSKSVKPILGSSGSSSAVLKEYGQTSDEGEYLLPGGEGTAEQIPATSTSTSIKSFSSLDKSDVTSKSMESLSTPQQSISAEKIALLEESTDAKISETSMSTPTKSFPSGDELDVTESLLTTQQSSGVEKTAGVGGHLKLLAESAGVQVSDIGMSAPTKSISSGVELDSTSKSTESSLTIEQSTSGETIEVAALGEEHEQPEVPHSQAESSNLEKNDFSHKCPQDEDEN